MENRSIGNIIDNSIVFNSPIELIHDNDYKIKSDRKYKDEEDVNPIINLKKKYGSELNKHKRHTDDMKDKQKIQKLSLLSQIDDMISNKDRNNNYSKIKQHIIKNRDSNYSLTNVCKTNMYRDYFGNICNWDYCSIDDDKFEDLLNIIK